MPIIKLKCLSEIMFWRFRCVFSNNCQSYSCKFTKINPFIPNKKKNLITDFENSFTNMVISVVKMWSTSNRTVYPYPNLLQHIQNCAKCGLRFGSLGLFSCRLAFLEQFFFPHWWHNFFFIFCETRLNSVHIWLQCIIFSPRGILGGRALITLFINSVFLKLL